MTGTTTLTEDGVVIGYVINFSKSGSVTVYHGQDGNDGSEGKDGHVPVIGVAKEADGKDGVTPTLKIEDGYWYVLYDNGAIIVIISMFCRV